MVVEDENGRTLDSLPNGRLVALIAKQGDEDLTKTHCLQYIDPYGETTFNML
ncbi:MAG: hypothetical protein ABI539_06565 [Acidobacteriota bacterium]